jgi:hypothetical protein
VLAPLARALRLSDDERAHLFRVAGHASPDAGRIRRHVTPSVQRVLDRLDDVPVMVIDAAWQLIAVNALAAALHGDLSGEPPRERNIAWRHLMRLPSRIAREPDEDRAMDAEIAADLRDALGRYPDDAPLQALIAVVYSAPPGSPDAQALALLGAVGLQSFAR